MATASIRQIIFSPAEFFKQSTTVTGTVVLLDHALGRMDISDDGAKLIVEMGSIQLGDVRTKEGEEEVGSSTSSSLTVEVGSRVIVTGRVKKQQRRTFLEAHQVEEVRSVLEHEEMPEDKENHTGSII